MVTHFKLRHWQKLCSTSQATNNEAKYRFTRWRINPELTDVGIPTYHAMNSQMVFQLEFSDVRNKEKEKKESVLKVFILVKWQKKKRCLAERIKKMNELVVWAGLKVEWPARKHSLSVTDVWQMFITNYNSAFTNCQAQT